MNRPGRRPGPLKGRTAEANALAQFLRELTAELTVSELEERYRLSRSVWSEYRSGQKIIPLSRLSPVIEGRFPRDARTRAEQLLKARRLHTEAVASMAALAPAAPAADPGPASSALTPSTSAAPPAAAAPDPVQDPEPEPDPDPSSERSPGPSSESSSGKAQPAPPREVRQEGEDDNTDGLSADNAPTSQDPAPAKAAPASQPPPAPRRRTERFRRWRTPAQWAALAALVAVLVIANSEDRANDKADVASPSELGPGQIQDGDPSTSPEPDPAGPTTPDPSEPAASEPPASQAAPPAAAPVTPSAPPTATPQPSADGNGEQGARAPGIPVSGPVWIVNRNSGFCLAVPQASTKIVDLNQFACGNYPDHFWRLEPMGRGTGQLYRVVNDNSGLCAAVPAADKAAGVVINQYPCGDHRDHLWRLDRDGADEAGRPLYRIVNENSRLCMTVAGADTRQTAAVVQTPCGSQPERQWRLTAR
ncbi:RICIN domain-containing protein [Streptomyces xanthophaeus]